MDELGAYDLPATVDYVLEKSNQSQLVYVGHSQGTSIGFLELTTNTDLASKIKLFVGLGPVATLGNVTNNSLLKVMGIANYLKFFILFHK